ncbi:uncharacterized protein E0L32_006126 [Thyridium curvatum]|uniref:Heterokaryon incompatibility domain-containing protein n=1 Tax=Thyridium curvatum TaxID=1093900 RepID=A0A507B2U6_9PEZI|nr:uncharacterized protein E0L32_006126 [Thyridium curvatum]TPX13396.1 hypothetical protein E0L32_006126 [Thyridium curvatum]
MTDADPSQAIYGPLPLSPVPLSNATSFLRFITIDPTADDREPISLQLTTVPLHDDLQYAALSYVWGDPTQTTRILANGHPLHVTDNLADALHQFRAIGMSRYAPGHGDGLALWVDAICINQSDLEERSAEVHKIGDIYARASGVISWLGKPDSRQLHVALGGVCQVAKALADSQENEVLGKGLAFLKQQYGHSQNPEVDNLWEAISSFSKDKYWTRVWIVQEVVKARSSTFACGSVTARFEDILVVDSLLRALVYGPTELYRNLPVSFANQLTRNTPPFRTAFVINTIPIISSLHKALAHSGDVPMREGCELPTWMPDLGGLSQYYYFFRHEPFSPYHWYRDLDMTDHSQVEVVLSGVLWFSGLVMDEVQDLLEADTDSFNLENVEALAVEFLAIARRRQLFSQGNTLHQLFHVLFKTQFPPRDGEEAITLHPSTPQARGFHTMLEDISVAQDTALVAASENSEMATTQCLQSELLCTFYCGMSPEEKGQWAERQTTDAHAVSAVTSRALGSCRYNRFFCTKEGLFGRGPPGTRSGDRICVYRGDLPPVILRKTDDHWVNIGEAYVYWASANASENALRSMAGSLERFQVH